MRRLILAFTALVTAAAGLTGTAAAAGAAGSSAPQAQAGPSHQLARASQVTRRELPKVVLQVGGKASPAVVQQQRMMPRVTAPRVTTANITVTYNGFPAPAQAAFQAAVDIWGGLVHSAVPIHIDANWTDLTTLYSNPNVLGSAGPTDFLADFPGAPKAHVFYPAALANAISGSDLEPPSSDNLDGAEISADFNSTFPSWYLGTDGQPGGSQVDLETVVLHELGHGLGMVGTYDGLNPTTGADQGRGYFGLSLDGQHPTVFDTFVTDGPGRALGAGGYSNGSLALGAVLRGASGGVRWSGPAAYQAAGCQRPVLYAPGGWEEGSSFSHLDENTYPFPGSPNALMTPQEAYGEADHSPGPIVLGMFNDMGWPTSTSDSALGTYYPVTTQLPRLMHSTGVSTATPITAQVTGWYGAPENVRAAVVNIEVKYPSTVGYWSASATCNGGPGQPNVAEYTLGQTRTSVAVVPTDSYGRIRVWISAGKAEVNVDLVGWYAAGGSYFHHLTNQQVGSLSTVRSTVYSDVTLAGRAGIPSTGATAVVLKARVSNGTNAGWLLIAMSGLTPQVPTLAYARGEMRSAYTIVPLQQSGPYAGKVRLRISAGSATVSLEVVGWYGAAAGGGTMFHPTGPTRDTHSFGGSTATVSGLPANASVLLDVHLSRPSAGGWVGWYTPGTSAVHGIQEYRALQPTAGTIVARTNANGQVNLKLSAGASTMYVDYLGWFSAT